MKTTIAVAMLLLVATPASVLAQGARLQLGHLDRLSSQAVESVNVTIDPGMLKMAAAFLKGEGEQAAVKEILNGITGIYVRTFEFDREHAYTPDDVQVIRRQLGDTRWSRLVSVDSKRNRELVEIYSWKEGKEPGGLAILVAQPRELTVVNIVGRIDLAKLQALQGNFGIPSIDIDPDPFR